MERLSSLSHSLTPGEGMERLLYLLRREHVFFPVIIPCVLGSYLGIETERESRHVVSSINF